MTSPWQHHHTLITNSGLSQRLLSNAHAVWVRGAAALWGLGIILFYFKCSVPKAALACHSPLPFTMTEATGPGPSGQKPPQPDPAWTEAHLDVGTLTGNV